MFRSLPIFIFTALMCIHAEAQKSDIVKLFQDEEPLSIRLGYSFKEIKKNTSDSTYFPSILYYSNDQQKWDSLLISVRGRGNFRRKNCFFIPLRIKIKKSEAQGTLFQGHKNLKLVLPCKVASEYNDLVMKEYVCYQMYDQLTPYTFNTRLVNLALTDQGGKQSKSYQLKAFFIEDDDDAAKRFNGKVTNEDLHPRAMNDTCCLRVDLFQYMIANTDWSSSFHHNSKIIQAGRKNIPIAYDFDMAGFVNAPYATYSETLDIKSVRDRVYRGYCRDENVVQFVRKDFIQVMPSVFEALNRYESNFDANEFTNMKKYIQEFFDILINDKSFQKKILEACRTH